MTGMTRRSQASPDTDTVAGRLDGFSPPRPGLSPVGLYEYAVAAADALGVGVEAVCCAGEDEPPTVYVALDQRCQEHPESDLALLWEPEHGWRLMLEPGTDPELVALARLHQPAPQHVPATGGPDTDRETPAPAGGHAPLAAVLVGLLAALQPLPRSPAPRQPGGPAVTSRSARLVPVSTAQQHRRTHHTHAAEPTRP